MKPLSRWVAAAALSCGFGTASAQVDLHFPSLDAPGGTPVMLKAIWFAADGTTADARAPAAVLLHGCGGAFNANGQLSQRLRDYAALLNQAGMHAMVLDSLTPRGERELCTQKLGTRRVTQTQRRLDALAALGWLAAQPSVNAARLGLIGWSNGGSTVLAATNRRRVEVIGADVKPAFAVAFYPGCEAELSRGYRPTADLLMLVGEADDWTPAEPCRRLAAQAALGPQSDNVAAPQIEVYPGAYHGFDSAAPLRVRKDVPGGVRPGQGVTVGGDAVAMQRSRERLMAFLAAQ